MGRKIGIIVLGGVLGLFSTAKMLSAQPYRNYHKKDTATAYAQNERIKERMAKIKEKLNLSEEQSAQIGDILKNSRGKLAQDRNALRNAPEADKAEARLNMKRDKMVQDSAILRSLNPDQKEKLIQRMKERHKRMKQYRLQKESEIPHPERRDIPMPSK